MKNNHERGKRGDVSGWSASASRRNVAFLRSVRPDSLTGNAFALTLTIRDCPPTPQDWHKLRRAFIERMRRRGMIRLHWVTEWQRRGVPHFHGIAYFSGDTQAFDIVTQWLEVAAPYGCLRKAQHVNSVSDVVGWFKYLAKHAARGHLHYQRNPDAIPSQWLKKTGRVWGYVGDWVCDEPVALDLDNSTFYRFRRLVRSWRVSNSRSLVPVRVETSTGSWTVLTHVMDKKRVKSAKTMLKCSKPDISRLRGVSEWVTFDVALLICDFLKSQGGVIES